MKNPFSYIKPKRWARLARVWKKKSVTPFFKRRWVGIKKFWQGYFIFWSYTIFLSHLLALMITGIIIFMADLKIGTLTPCDLIKMLLIFWGSHAIIVTIVRIIFITKPDEEIHNFCQIAIIDGQPLVLSGSLWGKGEKYYIEKFNHRNHKVTFEMEYKSHYRNATVTIPMSITLHTADKFDNIELFNILYRTQTARRQSGALSLDEYIRLKVEHINRKAWEKIDELVVKYVCQEISCPQMLDEATELLSFPEKPFSNVEDVSICLKEPSFSSCKGQSCNS